MAKKKKTIETQADKRNQSRVEPMATLAPVNDQVSLFESPGEFIVAAGNGSIAGQAARLNDKQVQSVQRRTMATQIGQIQGNRHLQKLIGSLDLGNTKSKPLHSTKPVLMNLPVPRFHSVQRKVGFGRAEIEEAKEGSTTSKIVTGIDTVSGLTGIVFEFMGLASASAVASIVGAVATFTAPWIATIEAGRAVKEAGPIHGVRLGIQAAHRLGQQGRMPYPVTQETLWSICNTGMLLGELQRILFNIYPDKMKEGVRKGLSSIASQLNNAMDAADSEFLIAFEERLDQLQVDLLPADYSEEYEKERYQVQRDVFNVVVNEGMEKVRKYADEVLKRLLGNHAVQRAVIQRNSGSGFDDDTAARINRERGGGQSLDGTAQKQMGVAMNRDFSSVRVHTSPKANDLSRQLGAKAFTTGQDIFFREGAYEPHTSSGQELVAHELTHVVQQSTGAVDSGGRMKVNTPGDAFEQEADAVAKAVTGPGVQVQRQTEEEPVQMQAEEEETAVQMQELEEDGETLQMQEMEEEQAFFE